jgi:HSP20 family molecular chaperone IbpA
MSRTTLFTSPLLLGFDHFDRLLDRVAKTGHEGYPPYNIEQVGDSLLRITLAVAGFERDELSITLEDNQLVIRGKQADQPDKIYLYRGIAARQFVRSFVLAEGLEIAGANLDKGLLHIDVRRPVPQTTVRNIDIRTATDARPEKIGPEAVMPPEERLRRVR